MLRKAADELVSLVWCLSKYEQNGQYPSKIKIDCLGAVIAQAKDERLKVFSDHLELMGILNDIANAFKHSFINSDHTLLGAEEPRIHALGLAHNKLNSEPQFYDERWSPSFGQFWGRNKVEPTVTHAASVAAAYPGRGRLKYAS